MRKTIVVLFAAIFLSAPFVKADEGMWLPLFIERLNHVDMQKMGLQLTAEEIYSVNNSSLKDAIIIFGGGCTGEIISDKGLILTNHHCGYGNIQSHSTVENNILKNGFWAKSFKEELPNEGLSVQFLVRIQDVTAEVLGKLSSDMTEKDRAAKVREMSNALVKEATEGTHHNASVRGFFEGNEYYLFVYETFNDVRLVGAPPESVGKYGSDTDNWMWPRHTGDFSIFRVYADAEGKPAKFSEENVPLKPRHFLPISMDGVKKGDFSMIMGYPGGTDRFLTSYGVQLAVDESNPTIVKIRRKKLDIMDEGMDADPKVRIQYASKYARTANYWKYFIGQTKGLKNLNVYDKKKEIEADYSHWASQVKSAEYKTALPLIEKGYEVQKKYNLSNWYFREAIYRGPEILGYARNFGALADAMLAEEPNQKRIDHAKQRIGGGVDKYFKDYNASIDEKLLAAMMEMYYKNVPQDQHPAYLTKIHKKYKGNFVKYAAKVFENSQFSSKEKVEAALADPNAKKLKKDPAVVAINAFIDQYYALGDKKKEAEADMTKGKRIFVDGLRKMNPEKKYYPDANFTMRLTYGKVLDYYPSDAVHFNYYTTLAGVMEKEDPSNWEFVVPDKLKELYKNKDYGQYGEDGVMKVCFLTDHDITGGNSGSPVINGKGELIGLAFDGNWEAMSGDIAFEPELQRTINVDIRYVLFIIDKYAGATNLIKEMKLVRTPKVKVVDKIGKVDEDLKESIKIENTDSKETKKNTIGRSGRKSK